jgi:hypothetical protein
VAKPAAKEPEPSAGDDEPKVEIDASLDGDSVVCAACNKTVDDGRVMVRSALLAFASDRVLVLLLVRLSALL